MAAFDPTQRRETWVFQRTGIKGRDGKPCLKRAEFIWVEYDDEPERLLEPRSHVEKFHDVDTFGNPVVPETDGTVIAGFEFIDSAIVNEVIQFTRA